MEEIVKLWWLWLLSGIITTPVWFVLLFYAKCIKWSRVGSSIPLIIVLCFVCIPVICWMLFFASLLI
jgi:hypothetical protein